MEYMVKLRECSEGHEILENVWNTNWSCVIKTQKMFMWTETKIHLKQPSS